MKRFQKIAPLLLLITLLGAALVGCTGSSAVITLGSHDDVQLSNGDYDLIVTESNEIEEKDLGDRRISLTEEALQQYKLYEIRILYTNQTSEPGRLSHRQLWLSFPGVEDPGDGLMLVGYCEPRADNPQGNPTFCAFVPPPLEPGVYGVSGIFQSSTVQVQPGDEARLYLIVVVDKDQDEVDISFAAPQE